MDPAPTLAGWGNYDACGVFYSMLPDFHSTYDNEIDYYFWFSEQITEFLGISSELLANRYCSGPVPSMAAADIKPEVHKLIHDLIVHIHDNEVDIEKGILVFLPTYRDLEQQWCLLKPLSSCFKVHILHRSVDTEQALMAMKIWKSRRKVCLLLIISCGELQFCWMHLG